MTDLAAGNNRRSRAELERRKELAPFIAWEMLRAPPLYAEESNNVACRDGRELQAEPR